MLDFLHDQDHKPLHLILARISVRLAMLITTTCLVCSQSICPPVATLNLGNTHFRFAIICADGKGVSILFMLGNDGLVLVTSLRLSLRFWLNEDSVYNILQEVYKLFFLCPASLVDAFLLWQFIFPSFLYRICSTNEDKMFDNRRESLYYWNAPRWCKGCRNCGSIRSS
jgi:hypothetical protein